MNRVLVGGQAITNVHPEEACVGQHCAVHNPSDHHMADWPQHFRCPLSDPSGAHPGLMERTCKHGVGHPDPDHMAWYASCHTTRDTRAEGTHGCDGCCQPPTD